MTTGTLCALVILAALPASPSTALESRPAVVQLRLKSKVFKNTRTLRVLKPPGYDDAENRDSRYPVFYFLDGIAAFDAWGLPTTAGELWSSHAIPPMLFVGIDNGGSTLESQKPVRDRASEYLPYADPSWDTPEPPQPRGDLMPSFLFDEVMPLVNARYRTDTAPAKTGLAGDSFAGVAALYVAMRHPERLGWLLVESPSLHIGNGRLLSEAKAATAWPGVVYLGVGTAEGEAPETQAEMLANARGLYASLAERPGVRTHLEVTTGGKHGYDAWHQRLPTALRWLLAVRPDNASGS